MGIKNVLSAIKTRIPSVSKPTTETEKIASSVSIKSAEIGTLFQNALMHGSGTMKSTEKEPFDGSAIPSESTIVTSEEIFLTQPAKRTGRMKHASISSSAFKAKRMSLPASQVLRNHMFIPDTQIQPGRKIDYISYLGHYAAHKRPDVICIIGDWWDMPSLSSYDVGKKSSEGKRIQIDLDAGYAAMERFFNPISNAVGYKPEVHFFEGNHEYRVSRAIENDAKWEGKLSFDDFKLKDFPLTVHRFLQPAVIDGVSYCHYFPSGAKGLAITDAAKIFTLRHMSSVCGHTPGRDIEYATRGDGVPMTALIAGSCYEHDETYVVQPQWHWRGFYIFHEVRDGWFDEMAVSIGYLHRKAKKEGWK